MQVNIQGLLVDPSGSTLPKHDIRITSKDDLQKIMVANFHIKRRLAAIGTHSKLDVVILLM